MSPVRVSSPGDLTRAARRCRDLGHAWDWAGDFDIVRRGREIIECSRLAVCERCETERVQVIEVPSMRVVTRRYAYPDAYLGTRGAVLDAGTLRQYALEEFLASPRARTRSPRAKSPWLRSVPETG